MVLEGPLSPGIFWYSDSYFSDEAFQDETFQEKVQLEEDKHLGILGEEFLTYEFNWLEPENWGGLKNWSLVATQKHAVDQHFSEWVPRE